MKYLILLFIILPALSFSQAQHPTPASWNTSHLYFAPSKMKVYNSKGQILSDGYKRCEVSIANADTYYPEITIDIPDKFLLKDGVAHKIAYEYENKQETLTYSIKQGKKIVTIAFMYDYNIEDIVSITVVGTDDYTKKPNVIMSVILYEFK